jgi:VanZ family protein
MLMPVAAMNLLLRLFAWLLGAAVSFATLGPARYRPHSHLGQDAEHSLAFVLIGVAFALAYPRHRLPATVIAVAMVGTLELLQLLVPGRHARLEDFAVDALATLTGFAIVSVLDVATTRRRRSNPTSP